MDENNLGNTMSENTVSENTVSEDTVSENTVSENTVNDNTEKPVENNNTVNPEVIVEPVQATTPEPVANPEPTVEPELNPFMGSAPTYPGPDPFEQMNQQQSFQQADNQAGYQAGSQANEQMGGQASSQTHSQAHNQTGNQTEATMGGQPYEQPVSNGKGFSIASMVTGIVSICACCIWYIGLPTAIVAVVLGIISLVKKYDGRGMAIAGIITGGIALLMFVLVIVGIVLFGVIGAYGYSYGF